MAQDHSAVLLGAAGSQIASGQEAHDLMMHDADNQGMEAVREATEAIKASRLDLESSTTGGIPSTSHDLGVRLPHLQESSCDVLATGNHVDPGVTTTPHDTTKDVVHQVGRVNGNHEPDRVAPSSLSTVPPSQLSRDNTPPATPPFTTEKTTSQPAAVSHPDRGNALSDTISSQQTLNDGGAGSTNIPHEGNMIFSCRGTRAPNVSHRRRQYATTSALTDYEADLTGKDRAKQKEAVRKLLMEKVRDDWKWDWPRPKVKIDPQSLPKVDPKIEPEKQPKGEPEVASLPSPVHPVDTQESKRDPVEEEYEEQWKERDEWISNGSDSGEDTVAAMRAKKPQLVSNENPFRFETPDALGEAIRNSQSERKYRRKKRLAEEMAGNDGVRCFIERRDAWTGARRVRRSRPAQPISTPVEQLQNFTSHSSEDGGSSTAMDPETEADEEEAWEADTEIPVAPPLIPPENAMRASITPTAYNTIYDKVILQNLSPSCPINLKDITRSCVQGWKRDGEWPPMSSVPDALAGRRRRKSLASLFGLEKTKSKEDKEKVDKEKVEKDAHKSFDDPKPGAFKKFTRKFLLLGKDKDHEHGKEPGNLSNGSNGKAKEPAVATPAV